VLPGYAQLQSVLGGQYVLPHRLPLRPFEEVPCRLLARILVGHDDVPHLVVLLEHLHHALKERLRKRGVDHIGRVVPHHLGHFLVHDVACHPFEAKEILARKLGPVPFIERVDDLGQRLFLFLGVRVCAELRDRVEGLGIAC